MEMPQQETSIGKKILIGVAVIAFIAIISALVDKDTQAANTKLALLRAEAASAKAGLSAEDIRKKTIPAQEIVQAYEQDEVKADEDFKEKVIYVSGTIVEIKNDVLEHTYVTLQAGQTFRQVQCYLKDGKVAAQLKKGMVVTFKGKCGGLMMHVLMKNCRPVLVE
ncbi:MAG: hypothetical protein QM731_07405 [Chitinophagaceae bacterium]